MWEQGRVNDLIVTGICNDGTGDPKRFRSIRLANGEGTDFPGEWHEQRP